MGKPYRLLASLAVPDASRVPLHGDLAAECASVFAVLLDFDLLDLLAERGTVAAQGVSPAIPSLRGGASAFSTDRVPYLPVMPTFFVRFVILADV